jgi:ADP-heptose:LPS heptosyltransferase
VTKIININKIKSNKKEILKFDKIFFPAYGKLESLIHYKENAVKIIAKMFNLKIKNEKINLYLNKEEKLEAKKIISKYKNPIIINTNSVCSEYKNWPLEKWNKLIGYLSQFTFIHLGGKDEKKLKKQKNYVDLIGKTSIRQAIALISNSKLVVCLDSFLNHGSVAANKKAIVLFGPSTSNIYGHKQNKNISVNLDCSPCTYKKPCNDNRCMKNISVNFVKKEILRIMKE